MSKIERMCVFFCMIGTNGTGKTTLIRKFMKTRERVLILPPNKFDPAWNDIEEIDVNAMVKKASLGAYDNVEDFFKNKSTETKYQHQAFKKMLSTAINSFTGVRKISSRHDEVFSRVIHGDHGYINGALVIDDFKNRIIGSNLTGEVRSLFSDRRHKMIDIYVATHGCTDVPPALLNFNAKLFLFKTTGNFERGSDNWLHFDRVNAIQKKVNALAVKNPHYFEIVLID